MKVCQTCGKVLNDSTEEYKINGIVQCRNCAYPSSPANIYEANADKAKSIEQNVKINNSWSNILKIVGSINIILGSIISIILGIAVYHILYASEAIIIALCVAFGGIIFSLLSSSLLMTFSEMADNIAVIRYKGEKQ